MEQDLNPLQYLYPDKKKNENQLERNSLREDILSWFKKCQRIKITIHLTVAFL